jgi:hypothetical protein
MVRLSIFYEPTPSMRPSTVLPSKIPTRRVSSGADLPVMVEQYEVTYDCMYTPCFIRGEMGSPLPDSAAPDDPNEISFQQGDIVDLCDKQGPDWWQVRKADGSVGSEWPRRSQDRA